MAKREKRYSLPTWKKPALQAAKMRVGPCQDAVGLVGFDMCAQDNSVFAHGHMDVETAEHFAADLTLAIAEARLKGLH